MISYLADFASRMEHISEIASVICRRNRNLAIEASFGDNELDNIIFAVLVHIMERSLTTNVRCTIEDIEDFLAELFKDYNREINESELRELTRYIVKDILQNKGESFKFKIMDHSDLTIKSYSVRLIRDIEDDDGVIYYVLEKQGFDMLFRTKEVDDLGFQLEEVRLHKLIERGNFSDASSQSKRLLAMLNQKEIDLTLFERRMKNDLSETSGEEYDTLIHEIEQMLDDEYAVMSDIKKTIGKAIESFSDSNAFSDRVKNELADKKRNIFMISNNTEKILVKQRELLSHSRELGQLYREMLLKTITMHRTHCYDIEDVILKLLEEYKGNNKLDIEELCAKLIEPLVLPKLPAMFDLRLVYEPQQSSEEVNGEIEEDEDSLEEVSPYTKEVERKNKANTEIIRLMFEFASQRKVFSLSDLWEYCLENADISLIARDKCFFLIMLDLYSTEMIDTEKWENEENKTEDSQGEFDLSYCLLKISSHNENFYGVKRILITRSGERTELKCEYTDEETGLRCKETVQIDNMCFAAEVM